jgi:membrane-bound metal-dependent hydrolase YbcI (DUF457 family)
MVMGPTHSMMGASSGLWLATTLPDSWGGATTPVEALAYAGIGAGAALLPDLDSPQATISRSFGPLTQGLSHIIDAGAVAFVNATGSKRDTPVNGGHRTATHTIWFALLMGVVAAVVGSVFGKEGMVGLLIFLLGLGLRGLFPDWVKDKGGMITVVASIVLGIAAYAVIPGLRSPVLLTSAVVVGVLTHLAGDFITKQGVPLTAPFIPVKGKRWWDWALPSGLRIRASGPADQALLALFSILAAWQAFAVVAPAFQ